MGWDRLPHPFSLHTSELLQSESSCLARVQAAVQRKSLLGQGVESGIPPPPGLLLWTLRRSRQYCHFHRYFPWFPQTDPVIGSASFNPAQLRNRSFQEARLSLGLNHRILQLGDEREQRYHFSRQVCDIFMLEMMFQVVKWAFPF